MTQKNWITSLAETLFAPGRARPAPAPKPRFRPAIEGLEGRALPAALTTITTLGDSLTAAYAPDTPRGAAGDQSWAQLLQAQGDRRLAIDNVAVAGATSADVLANQLPTAVDHIAHGTVRYATLIVGANDVLSPAFLPQILAGYSQPFVAAVTANVEGALTQLEAAASRAHVRMGLAVGTIPDVGATPALQFELVQNLGVPVQALPAVLHNVTVATQAANAEIVAFAARHHLPVVDLFGLGQLATDAPARPVHLGGVAVANLYAPDFFHPNTVGQGLLADTVLSALAAGYTPHLQVFRLTDQQILDAAGIAHRPGHSFSNVDKYFIIQAEQNPRSGFVTAAGSPNGKGANRLGAIEEGYLIPL